VPGASQEVTNTSLAFEAMFGELAIKVVFHDSEGLIDLSLLRVNERKLDFTLVVHQLESMYHFASRGMGIELWYTDKDVDLLRIKDTPGLEYACQDWRDQLNNSRPGKKHVRSMLLQVNETAGT
jgi:hypothetical protein